MSTSGGKGRCGRSSALRTDCSSHPRQGALIGHHPELKHEPACTLLCFFGMHACPRWERALVWARLWRPARTHPPVTRIAWVPMAGIAKTNPSAQVVPTCRHFDWSRRRVGGNDGAAARLPCSQIAPAAPVKAHSKTTTRGSGASQRARFCAFSKCARARGGKEQSSGRALGAPRVRTHP